MVIGTWAQAVRNKKPMNTAKTHFNFRLVYLINSLLLVLKSSVRLAQCNKFQVFLIASNDRFMIIEDDGAMYYVDSAP